MRYLGGKSKLAAAISAEIRARVGGAKIWEPFCGGCSVTCQLAAGGYVLATDICSPLVSMYKQLQLGWEPPATLTEAQYHACKLLPDSDPLKAFAGFAVSYASKYFGGFARGAGRDFAAEGYRNLKTQRQLLAGVKFGCFSFFDITPRAHMVLYCDPPYTGTTAYTGTVDFDSARFWQRASDWVAAGSRVFVSEFSCPVASSVLWTKARKQTVSARPTDRLEFLYEVTR